jgi:hypothetical protein
MSDYANEYTKPAMKVVLPELLTELVTNTVFSKIIGRMCPRGIDVAKMGRVGCMVVVALILWRILLMV